MRIPINFKKWIDDNRHLLKPPVCNKVVWEDSDFIIMVVGGPNSRKDYHVDVEEEFFYQIEGSMTLKIIDQNKKKDININEGEIYLLPANVPHSPQRSKNSVGLVVEKTRKPTDLDGFQWYCDNCDNLIYEKFSQVSDIVNQLPIIFDEFWNNLNNRTCKKCNQILEK
ncbi:MAG: 3-hydroxyanthranilate 3,4-dioxygenase [Candidatus Marinimicrobia bacterium]|nr:3-hydroxyanthranilate 3,4-dioxygenase [Candidatus Neomarinimicrobiota bacterium]|tara:strand:- start:4665 stop:5168 length:504 start_codon:yes stop_codon:yes gene_type:complete